MNYPCLVPKHLCKTDIHITIHSEEISEDGEPIPVLYADLKCNYQDSAKRILTENQQLIQLSGIALLPGDICPELPALSSGTVIIYGVERTIHEGRKARNPDGSVNYTELRLI